MKEYLNRSLEEVSPSYFIMNGDRVRKSKDNIIRWLKKNPQMHPKNIRFAILDDEISAEVQQKIEEFVVENKNKNKSEMSESGKSILQSMGETAKSFVAPDMSEFIPYLNMESGIGEDQYIMVHKTTQTAVLNLKYLSWIKLFPQDEIANITSKAIATVKRYNPHIVDRTFLVPFSGMSTLNGSPSNQITALNLYNPPKWRLNPIQRPTIHPLLKKFFEHLFPDSECRRYVFERIWFILYSRLEVFLVLNGGTGIGKGLFTDELMKFGVGEDNSIIAPESWDKSHFNAWLFNRQLVVLDEVKVSAEGNESNINLLKRLINERLNIEMKGKDAAANTKSYASFFLTSNHGTKNFKLEEDNRRFSVLDVTDVKLDRAFSPQEKEELLRIIKEDDDIRGEFFWYITYNYGPDKQKYPSSHTLWYGPTYRRFQYESRPYWQRVIIDLINTGEKSRYVYGELAEAFRNRSESEGRDSKFTVKKESITTFLQNYRDDSGENFAKVLYENGVFYVEVNKKYVKESTLVNEKYGLEEVDCGL